MNILAESPWVVRRLLAAYPPPSTTQLFVPGVGTSTTLNLYEQDGTTIFLSTAPPNNKFGKLTIFEISIKPFPVPSTNAIGLVTGSANVYFAQLTLKSQKGPNLVGASKLNRSDIRMAVQIDAGNNIVSCSSLTFFGSDLQPIPVCGPGQSLFSNGHQIRCVQAVCLGPNFTPNGYNPNGDIICK